MRLLLETPGRTWSLGPGLSLIGSAPDCHVRIEAGPLYAAAIVRWFQTNTLYPIGTPAPMQVNGQTHGSHPLRHGDHLTLGGIAMRVRLDPQPGRGLTDAGPDQARQLRRALDAGRSYASEQSATGRSRQLLRVVSAVTGASRVSAPRKRVHDGVELTLYRDDSKVLRLEWGKRPQPDGGELAHKLGSLGAALDDVALWENASAAAVLPYREHTLRIFRQDVSFGAYGVLGWPDFCHLDLSRADVRDPLILVSTFRENLHLLDLSGAGALKINRSPVAHAVVESGMRLSILEQDVDVLAHPAASALLPMPLQALLGAPDDVVAGAFSLGCVLTGLKSAEERAEACLLAAITLSGAHSGSLVWTTQEPSSVVATLVEISRHQSQGWMRSTGIPSRHLDALTKRAIATGKPAIAADLLADPELASVAFRPGEPLAIVGGAMAVALAPKGAALVLTRTRGRPGFVPGALAVAIEIASRIEPLAGLAKPPARLAQSPEPAGVRARAWLRAGAVRVPLPEQGVVLVGRDDSSDLRLTGDGTVSRTHAAVVTSTAPAECQVVDMRSSNGTYVDGRLVEQAPLAPGARLSIGDMELTYEVDPTVTAEGGEPRYVPVSRPVEDLQTVALGAAPAPTGSEALEAALPALALVAGASKARWVRGELFGEGAADPGHCLLVPQQLAAGGWIALDGLPAGGAQSRPRRLAAHGEGVSMPVDRPLWIGRGPECDIRVQSESVSRRHALLVPTAAGCDAVDARSSLGTRVNGVPILKAQLSEGDLLETGPLALVFTAVEGGPRAATDRVEAVRALLRTLAEARSESLDPLERLTNELAGRLQAASVGLVRAGGGLPEMKAGSEELDPTSWMRLEGAVEAAFESGRVVVEDLDEPRLYRPRHGSIPLFRIQNRSALIMPLPGKPLTAALALTGRMPRVAFEFAAVRWICALASLLF
ncbi:MAG: FHA domain-containing protein [Candidatus Wallbacteria bacterium]|nr:FHA domain-containing protein [Candidatus Wallbacteria bacterium]